MRLHARGMLAALALADYNVLDEWRKKMGGTVKSTVDPMTGHVSSLHRASSGTGWGVAKEYEDDRAKLMKSFPEKYGKGCRVACMMACIKKCPPEIHLATCEETNGAPQCRQKCIEMGME